MNLSDLSAALTLHKQQAIEKKYDVKTVVHHPLSLAGILEGRRLAMRDVLVHAECGDSHSTSRSPNRCMPDFSVEDAERDSA